MSIDNKALFDITYGMYILSGKKDGIKYGRIVDAVVQQNFSPVIVTVSLMKTGYSVEQIDIGDKIGISTLSEDIEEKILYNFGMKSSNLFDKFKDIEYIESENGIPIVLTDAISYMECEVTDKKELEDHIMLYLKVINAKKINNKTALTYTYYFNNLKDKVMNVNKIKNMKGVNKMLKFDFYYCPMCKNLVEVIDKGIATISCCGTEMIKLEPNTEEASLEKHLPVVHFEDNTISVFVGEVEHPMEAAHYIKKIVVVAEDGTLYRKELKPSDVPEATFDIGDSQKVDVYAYCNQHGLWKTEASR